MTSPAVILFLALGGSAAVAGITVGLGLALGLDWWQAIKDTISMTMGLPKG